MYGPRLVPGEERVDGNAILRKMEPCQFVLTCYRNGGRLFTKAQLAELENYLSNTDRTEPFRFHGFDGYDDVSNEATAENCLAPRIWFLAYQKHLYWRYENLGCLRCIFVQDCDISHPESLSRLTHVELQAKFNKRRTQRGPATVDNQLSGIISAEKIPTNITKIVCVELGNLELGNRCIDLHIAALAMRDAIQAKTGQLVRILAQNLNYTPATQTVLRYEGVEVLGGHGALGFIEIDGETVVYSISPNAPVKQIIADIARPAIYVGDRISNDDENDVWQRYCEETSTIKNPFGCDPDSPRTRELFKSPNYKEIPLSNNEAFVGSSIYIRQDE
ncbi:hypothetical protein F4861DRAFT_544839 [Xylaria intraflava]|nr:hypothetical protein F4861DRAFT_544839 [Xylaria intraflava]